MKQNADVRYFHNERKLVDRGEGMNVRKSKSIRFSDEEGNRERRTSRKRLVTWQPEKCCLIGILERQRSGNRIERSNTYF